MVGSRHLLRCNDASFYHFDGVRGCNAASLSDLRARPSPMRPPARKAAWVLNVRKIPTRFIDISGVDWRRSSYSPAFYNSTQFAQDQVRARRASALLVTEQTFPKHRACRDRGERADARAPLDTID